MRFLAVRFGGLQSTIFSGSKNYGNLFFYDARGEKVGPTIGVALKALAQQGVITPETTIENEHGRTTVASQVKGLTFAEPKQPKTPPVQAETYDFASLSFPPYVAPDPFSTVPPVETFPLAQQI